MVAQHQTQTETPQHPSSSTPGGYTAFFSAGCKGGVGKSVFARALAQYLLNGHIPFKLIETDRVNPDVYDCYQHLCPSQRCIISESQDHENSANAILNSALESHVLVNLPAQVFPSLRGWFKKNNVEKLAKRFQIQMHCAHLSNGSFDSNTIFKRYIKYLPFDHYYFIQNNGVNRDWSGVAADPELQTLFKREDVTVVDFPELHGAATRNKIDQLQIPYGQVLEDLEHFDMFDMGRIETFLDAAGQAFQNAGIFSQGAATRVE